MDTNTDPDKKTEENEIIETVVENTHLSQEINDVSPCIEQTFAM